MKRFWLFAGESYYPSGGMKDFVESYNSRKEAVDEGLRLDDCDPEGGCWWEVFDTKSGVICDRNYGQSELPEKPQNNFIAEMKRWRGR